MSDNNPTSLNCPACGAPLEPDGTHATVRCKFCGNVALIPGFAPGQAGGSASAMDEIRRLVGSGSLSDAIQRYQQAYGVDLQDAQEAIDALQAGRTANPTAPGMRPPEELTRTLKQVQQLLASGNKIEAIKVYREHFDVSLERAKSAVDQIEAGGGYQAATGFQALGQPPVQVASPAPARRSWAGCIVGVIVLVVAGAIGFFAFNRGGPLTVHYNNNGPAVMVPAGVEAAPNIAAAFYNADKDAYFAGLLNGTTGKAVWYAPILASGANIDAIVAGTDLVYVASGSSLLAYHDSDGSLAWQTQMPDKLNYGDSVMLVTAGRVITDNADQSIQAYDAATGSLAWNMRLTGYDRTLRLMGSSLVVVDYVDNNNDYGLVFVDPITGAKQQTLTPVCNYNDYTSNLDPDSGLVYDATGNAIYLIFDSSYGCVQRLDLTSGKATWETDSQDGFNFSSNGFQSLNTDSTIYFSNDNDLLSVDKSSGEMKLLLNNPDYELLPLAVAGDKLIVQARRTRGTERFELWGVDASTGTQAWQFTLQGASPIDPPDKMAGLIDDNDYGWTWKLASTGLVLITFQGQPNQMTVETFNPADGSSLGKKTIALSRVSGDFYDIPSVLGWQGDVVYLSLDLGFYSLDVTTGQLKFLY